MKLKTVTYSYLSNLGNYRNERIELSATLEEGDDWEASLQDLKNKVLSQTQDLADYEKNTRDFYEKKRELEKITKKLEQAKQNWEMVSDFLKAQGIKSDPPNFPTFAAALPPATEVVDGEIDEIPFDGSNDDGNDY